MASPSGRNAALTVGIALLIAMICINPIWEDRFPPFEMPRISPAITAPIDGPFYIRNASQGYDWRARDPRSLWFHPLLPGVIRLLPMAVPLHVWFFIACVLAGAIAVALLPQMIRMWMPDERVTSRALPLLLLTPAGLALGTGTPELVCLAFNAGIMLGILYWTDPAITFICAVGAILSKPNALYMIPVMLVYIAGSTRPNAARTRRLAAVGLGGLLLGWAAWILIVGWQAGDIRAYWDARLAATRFVPGTPQGFFDGLAGSFAHRGEVRDRIRFSMAVVIPLVNIWLAGAVRFRYYDDRYAVAIGNAAMLAIALIYGNPNKILLYALTLPGNLAVHLVILHRVLFEIRNGLARLFSAAAYGIYCAALLVVFVWGTPVGWYY